jgi:hypothetical protein
MKPPNDELHRVFSALWDDEDLSDFHLELLAPRDDETPLWWPMRRDPPWAAEERRRVLLMRIRRMLLSGVPLPPVTREDREYVIEAIRVVRDWLVNNGPEEVLDSEP